MAVMKETPEIGHDDSLASRALDKMAHWIAFRTLPMFFAILTTMILLSVAAIAAGDMTFTEDSDRTWEVASGSLARDRDAINLALQLADPVNASAAVKVREAPDSDWSLVFLYDMDTEEDVLQSEVLREMCRTERLVFNHTGYSDFCVLDSNGKCASQDDSIVFLFYGPSPNCTLLDEAYVSARAHELYTALNTIEGQIEYGRFVGKDSLARSPRFSVRSKTVLNFGAPLRGFLDADDRDDKQLELLLDGLFKDLEKDLFRHFGLKSKFLSSHYRNKAMSGPVEVRWFSVALNWLEFERLLVTDMSIAALSIIFVLVWMRVHTGSFFIASLGMLQIVLSLPMAAFFYGSVAGVPYFQTLHVLIIFLVLGIGADDIFVYHDGWRQTIDEPRIAAIADEKERLLERVRVAYSRTARAVFNTSFTTTVAFLAQTGSEIMPIRSLGIYAALAVVINYILAITFTPVVVLVAERYFSGLRCGGYLITCCWVKKQAPAPLTTVTIRKAPTMDEIETGSSTQAAKTTPPKDGETAKPGVLERFYTEPMVKTVTVGGFAVKPIGMVVFIAMCAYAAQAFYFAFQLTPPNSEEQWFPDDHMWTGFVDDLQNNYISQTDEQYVEGRLSFGIEGVDRSGFDFWHPAEFLGTPILDNHFNGTSLAAQQGILDVCASLRARACDSSGCDVPLFVFPESVQCFMEDFRDWANETHGVALPAALPEEQFMEYILEFRAAHPQYESEIGIVDGRLRFFVIDFLFTIPKAAGYDATGEVINIANDVRREMEELTRGTGLGSVIIAGDASMVFYDTQTALIRNLIQGLGISTPVVFFLLIFATKNLQIAAMAVVSVLSIVAAVLGLCQWNGWDLGIAEAIAGVIVIGFAVDYTLHLGHSYMEAAHHGHVTREARFRYAMSTMGGTVVAGAVTTFGSGAFMFLSQLTFFYKMAVLMCSTIAFSFLFSFGFFMAHCAVMGPEGDFGVIPLDRIFAKRTAKEEQSSPKDVTDITL